MATEIDPEQLKEAQEFMDNFVGLVKMLQPDDMDEMVNFCNSIIPNIIEWQTDLDTKIDECTDLQNEVYTLRSEVDSLESDCSSKDSEISDLHNQICCLEMSKGNSRY